MRTAGLVLILGLGLALVGCDDGHNPPLPGDGDGDGTGDGDGDGDGDGGGDATTGLLVSGTVCPVTDLRYPDDCDGRNLSSATVAVRGTADEVAATADGSFELEVDAGTTSVVLEVAGDDTLDPSLVVVELGDNGASGVSVPIADADAWASLTAALVGAEPDGTATIAVYLRASGAPAEGAELTPPVTSTILPYYDAGAALSWQQGTATGVAGAALLFGVPTSSGTTSFGASNADASVTRTVSGVPLEAGRTTFVTVDLTP